jgi:hypothetical protein
VYRARYGPVVTAYPGVPHRADKVRACPAGAVATGIQDRLGLVKGTAARVEVDEADAGQSERGQRLAHLVVGAEPPLRFDRLLGGGSAPIEMAEATCPIGFADVDGHDRSPRRRSHAHRGDQRCRGEGCEGAGQDPYQRVGSGGLLSGPAGGDPVADADR